jgi:hypothetical protein
MPGSMANTDTAEDKEDYSPYIAQMSIFRPVRMYTLTSLLAHPVKWIQGRHTKTHAIQGLSAVDIDAHGALLPSIKDEEDVAFRNVVKACSFKTTDVQTDALDESIKQLVKFMPVIPSNHERRPRGVWDPYPAITIYTSNREELDAWLANVSLPTMYSVPLLTLPLPHSWLPCSFVNQTCMSKSPPSAPSPATNSKTAFSVPLQPTELSGTRSRIPSNHSTLERNSS